MASFIFCLIDVVKDQLMVTEVVSFINKHGGKIHSSLFNDFFWRNMDWKLGLEGRRNFCLKSNGELTWAIDGEGEETVSTKDTLSKINKSSDGIFRESRRRGDQFSIDEVRVY